MHTINSIINNIFFGFKHNKRDKLQQNMQKMKNNLYFVHPFAKITWDARRGSDSNIYISKYNIASKVFWPELYIYIYIYTVFP